MEDKNLVKQPKIKLTKDEINEITDNMKKGKIIVSEIESDEVDYKLRQIYDEITRVETKLRKEEDNIIAEFIYSNTSFNHHYCIRKEDIKKVFEFYLSFAPLVDDIRKKKIPNIIKRKIKRTKWKLKRRKQYKQQLKGE